MVVSICVNLLDDFEELPDPHGAAKPDDEGSEEWRGRGPFRREPPGVARGQTREGVGVGLKGGDGWVGKATNNLNYDW